MGDSLVRSGVSQNGQSPTMYDSPQATVAAFDQGNVAPEMEANTYTPGLQYDESGGLNAPDVTKPNFLQSNKPQVASFEKPSLAEASATGKGLTKKGLLLNILMGAAGGAAAGYGTYGGEGFQRGAAFTNNRKLQFLNQQQRQFENQRQQQQDQNAQAEADRQAAEAPLNTKLKQQTIEANTRALAVKNQTPEELFDSRTETATKLGLSGDARVRFQATGQLPEDFGKREKPETLDDKLVKDYVAGGMTETQAIEKVNKDKRTHISINNSGAGFGDFPDNPGATGDAALKGVPSKVATLVKGIANYDFDPSVLSNRNNQRANVLALVKQYDPSYDQTQYGVKKDVRKAFTSGDASKNIRSLNTAIGHLDQLQKAADALDSGNYPALNSIANKFSVASGDDPVTTFNAIANAVIGETASVYKGSGATDQEIQHVQGTFDAAQSPKQKRAAVRTTIGLFGSRLKALESQYAEAMGKPADFSILNDESKKIVDDISGKGGTSSKATHVFNPATGKVEAK
jgi:hypothetical protein